MEIENENIKNFFLVAFAQILKTCSIWLQKSIKQTRDLRKKDYAVLSTFLQKAKKMIKKTMLFIKFYHKISLIRLKILEMFLVKAEKRA